jgi:hypothetical protein
VVGTDLFKETVTIELLDNEVVKEIALDELVPPGEKSQGEADQA